MTNDRRNNVARRTRKRSVRRSSSGLDGTRLAAFAVLAFWGFSNLYDIFSLAYDPPEGIHAVALAAATYLFFRRANGSDS